MLWQPENQSAIIWLHFCDIPRYTDMESEDYPFFQGLVYLLENDVSTLGYELTFSTEVGVYFLCIFFCLMEFNIFLKGSKFS